LRTRKALRKEWNPSTPKKTSESFKTERLFSRNEN
jgi:hypothetical protein